MLELFFFSPARNVSRSVSFSGHHVGRRKGSNSQDWGEVKQRSKGKCDSKQWTPDLEPRPLERLGLQATYRAEIATAQVSRGGVASQLNVVQISVPHTWKSHDAWAGHQHPGPRPAISLRTRPAMMREKLPDKGRTAAFLDTGKHLEMSGWRKWQN